ncbi:class I SAM-dependent methyltransferase [Nocardiopsis tropica]|uniref:Class I SAM-dependent methyltransferase n=1 Tax=Nocardiopsis tropica TaxID=109330 RepID=A0ABU7KKL7_9ACTN|nr:class I SAM-dependent methyltransferase [Nocardiopsis umidischolae]MEE2049687.1 class I SAM-dependent methyltransferase [Nocardiopsis umidischolae]
MPDMTPGSKCPSPDVANTEQDEVWNGDDGRHWAANRERYDAMLARYTPHLLEAAEISPRERVLDIGCGAGVTTCAAARTARSGEALGVDLSWPLLDQARERAEREGQDNVRFERADAQVHSFPEASFDVAISRFGVMFFADPVAAFTNIARSLAPRGRVAFLCWQQPMENEWIVTLGAALAAHVEIPTMDEDGPGPFSLAEPERARSLLEEAGFDEVAIDPAQEPVSLGADVAEAMAFTEDMGPVRYLLAEVDPATRARALGSLREALTSHATEDGVRVGSAAWLVTARRA